MAPSAAAASHVVRIRRSVTADAFTAAGRIDVIVSNAGFGVLGAAEELSDEMLHRQIDVNLIGAIELTRTVVPRLRAQGGGRILRRAPRSISAPRTAASLFLSRTSRGETLAAVPAPAAFAVVVTAVPNRPLKTTRELGDPRD
jgi:NAD(P)-dependent dehydrogenase (short-subunit alcohol dehydrogenase family)